jgi:hypothetical protein
MPAELGGSQISSLLEALPGIASVLRSPVADALIKAMRAARGLVDFTFEDAEELVRYAWCGVGSSVRTKGTVCWEKCRKDSKRRNRYP